MIKYFSQYSPIDTVDDDEKPAKRFGAESRLKSHALRLWLSHGVLICTSILSFALWMRTPSTQLINDTPNIYTPASVAVEPVFIRFNGSLDFPSIYRGPPSPEIDAAWNGIANNLTQMTREEILKGGTSEAELPWKARYPEKIGGQYIGFMEAIHQLHCVSEYYESIKEPVFQTTPRVLRAHIGEYYFCLEALLLMEYRYGPDHCTEMIRQNIMCRADTTMISWYWVQGETDPYPNFNTRHRCRNFDKIWDWSIKNSIHIAETEVTRYPDTVNLPRPKGDKE
ncbi:uncharacterized protein HD556DRAFT_1448424 [Suillus plorans]|uniref:Uncharacterized protein n=1 Tax=Suillus plorans TaxID=116603 RepID=A0A9P7DCG7_9AGAM|nr:uncharacterized protein HD556DRAFT_1448424 [Suillus plorans]KAG1787741.1 hypothetical protein HD556DRAFT_1448424 [Suillus plorans]